MQTDERREEEKRMMMVRMGGGGGGEEGDEGGGGGDAAATGLGVDRLWRQIISLPPPAGAAAQALYVAAT